MSTHTGAVASANRTRTPMRYRWAVASRAAAAIGGGYVFSACVAAALSLLLAWAGMARADAVMAATMLAFVAHAVAALWAFGCANAWRAWAGIALPAALLGLGAWIFTSKVVA